MKSSEQGDVDSTWGELREEGLLLRLRVQPGARRSEFRGVHDGRLKLRIAAPPVDGAANKALMKQLAKWAGLRQNEVGIVAGEKSRTKDVLLVGIDAGRWRESTLAALIRKALPIAD